MDVSVAYVWTTRGDSSLDFNCFISPVKRKKYQTLAFSIKFSIEGLGDEFTQHDGLYRVIESQCWDIIF